MTTIEDQADALGTSRAVQEDDWTHLGEGEPHLTFRIGAMQLAVPSTDVEEVMDAVQPTSLPRAPAHVPGVVNLRGRAVPLVDLRVFLQLAGQEHGRGDEQELLRRIVVVRAAGMRVGLPCDRVRGITHVPAEAISDLEVSRGGRIGEFARGEIEGPDGVIAVLNLAQILEQAKL